MNELRLTGRKAQLRSTVGVLRDAMPRADRAVQSEQAASLLLDQLDDVDGVTVGLFWPIGSEIDALALVDPLRDKGADLALPATIGESEMVFRQWLPGCQMVEAGFGTFAPDASARIVEPQILVTPLLAFDAQGNRLGYGAGYYDRYIAGLIEAEHKPRAIGLAFSLQKLDKVPVGLYDLPLDMIVTEAGIIHPSG